MSLNKIEALFDEQLAIIEKQGISKRNELIICDVQAAKEGNGPRYFLADQGGKPFLRMNSNSYLGLSIHPAVIEAELEAVEKYGVGPGAVRFISGTYQPHKALEQKLADFHGRESAMLFSSAYAAMLGVLPQLITQDTLVVSDSLNHNCIINAIRLAKPAKKVVYAHLDFSELKQILHANQGLFKRVCVVSDGVFSMRGDFAHLDEISAICKQYEAGYQQGIITVVDDSHGVGAFGEKGRGTEEVCQTQVDVLIATLGKSFAVNGGYVVSSAKMTNYLIETAPLYIFSNPITASEAAAALKVLEIIDSPDGVDRLVNLQTLGKRLRAGLINNGFETLPGEHPIVPVLIRNTETTTKLVKHLFAHSILATGLNYPVVPKGEEEIRLQVSTSHTEQDIDYLLQVLKEFRAVPGISAG